jgi:potassium/chloride transporter 8
MLLLQKNVMDITQDHAPITKKSNDFYLFFRSFFYLYFMVVLAATCDRTALLTDYVIAEKVSALGFLLLAALYISSASSCLATLYGTPRVLQSIAAENVIPSITRLAEGVS